MIVTTAGAVADDVEARATTATEDAYRRPTETEQASRRRRTVTTARR